MTATMPETDSDRLRLVMELAREKGHRPSSNDVKALLSCGRTTANKLLGDLDRWGRSPAQGGPTLLPRPAEPAVSQRSDLEGASGPDVARTAGPRLPVLARLRGLGGATSDRLGHLADHRDDGAASKPPVHRGWLLVLALPAFVAVWGGWVGLGGLAGFGPVELLPGIWDALKVNLAVTLPAGMEVYAVIGLRVWLSSRTRSVRTRRFATWSTCLALVVGCSGQVAYHVLSRPVTGAPMFVTVCVACLPVALLGMGAALFHLVGDDQRTGDPS